MLTKVTYVFVQLILKSQKIDIVLGM